MRALTTYLMRASVLVALMATPPLRSHRALAAQPTIGTSLPELSLMTWGGATVSLRRQEGEISITEDKKTTRPRVLIVHFFQPDEL